MDLQWSWTRSSVLCVLLVSVVTGSHVQVFGSDLSLNRDIRAVNDFTNISTVIRNLNGNDIVLQLRCAVGLFNDVSPLPIRVIEQGQSHTWTMDRADEKSNKSITCSLMTSARKLNSFSVYIDTQLKFAESEQDWPVNEDGLRKSGASKLSAHWEVDPVNEPSYRMSVPAANPPVKTLDIFITINNVMQGANPVFTRVDMKCVAMFKKEVHSLGSVSIFAWYPHVWKLTQRNHNPDTVFCTFSWMDDFHQSYTMDAEIFDSKPRGSDSRGFDLMAFRRDYFVTKTGLAIGQQEDYVAVWTKVLAAESPL